jgi:hypothetical protein
VASRADASGSGHTAGRAARAVPAPGGSTVYIADAGSNRVVEVPASGGAQTTVGTGLNGPQDVAVDAAGDVFIADSGNNRVVEVPAGCTAAACQTTVGTGLNNPDGVAVDAAGDVFIADAGNNQVVKVPAGGGAQTTVGTGLNNPFGVAVDAAGDVFISDSGNSRVVEVPAGGGAQTTVGTGLSVPVGVAVDAAGDVFIADTFNSRVVEVPAGGGAQTTVDTGLSFPEGVAVGPAPSAPTGVSAVPGAGEATVSFTASASPHVTGYTVTATDTTNPARGGQSAQGTTSPVTVTGLTPGDGYTFTVTATNAAGATSLSSAPSSPVTIPAATTTTLVSSLDPSVFGQSVTFTATVTGSSPTGTITFKDGTTTLATAPLSGGQATFTTSSLVPGSHSITAVYGGDANNLPSTSSPFIQTVSQAGTGLAASDTNFTRASATLTFASMSATLTNQTTGAPVAGQTITFTSGEGGHGTLLCTAVTDAQGLATCASYTGPNPPSTSQVAMNLREHGYTATYTPPAGSDYTGSTAHAEATQTDEGDHGNAAR